MLAPTSVNSPCLCTNHLPAKICIFSLSFFKSQTKETVPRKRNQIATFFPPPYEQGEQVDTWQCVWWCHRDGEPSADGLITRLPSITQMKSELVYHG